MMRTETQKPDVDSEHAAALRNYEAAVRHIQKQNYDRASELLEKLVADGPAEIADRARVYLRLCGSKLQPGNRALKSVEDFYVAGVAELNARKLEQALEYLHKAEKLNPKSVETHYAMASAYALLGNGDSALEHLAISVSLDPRSRFQARHDEDFQSIAADPRFVSLLSGERSAAAGAAS